MSDPTELYASHSSSASRRSIRSSYPSSSSRYSSYSHRRSASPDRSRDPRRRRSPPSPPPPPPPPSSSYKSSNMRVFDNYYETPRKRARTKEPPLSPEPKPTHMLDVYHPSAMGSKVMVRTLPDIKNMPLNLRDSPHPEISQTVFDAMAENKKARLVQYYSSTVRDPDVDHVIWTSVSVRAVNPGDGAKSFYFGAYACCWEGSSNRNGLAAAFQGIAKTNIYAEYSAAFAALQACHSDDSVLIKTSSGPVAHALLKGIQSEKDPSGPRPPHLNVRDAFIRLIEKRRGRVYIRLVPSKSIIPVGAKVVKMAEKARRDYEASVRPGSEISMNALLQSQSPPPAPIPSHIQQGTHPTTTSHRGVHAMNTTDIGRVPLQPSVMAAIQPTSRWNDTSVHPPPHARSPVEYHPSRLDPSTLATRARDPRIRRMEENRQRSRMEYHHHHVPPPPMPMPLSNTSTGNNSPREQRLLNDTFSMSESVDVMDTKKGDDDSDDEDIFYDAKDYLDDDDQDMEHGKSSSPPRRMAQVAIAAKGSISAWVNTMFDKYHIQ
ncbi:hypothetical protein K492DRAFT_239444 [Lichtheimia hyalospora FSU 10163]|nr:hypothetical protein K492DRAFT_239444 [Lichtheimia hyalospora FSU 10163]